MNIGGGGDATRPTATEKKEKNQIISAAAESARVAPGSTRDEGERGRKKENRRRARKTNAF